VVKIGFQLFIFLVKHNLAAEYRTYTGVAVIHSIIKNKTPTQITRSFATFLPRVHIYIRGAEMQIVCKSQNACWFFRRGMKKKGKQQLGEGVG
jgi:hypothetical protein